MADTIGERSRALTSSAEAMGAGDLAMILIGNLISHARSLNRCASMNLPLLCSK